MLSLIRSGDIQHLPDHPLIFTGGCPGILSRNQLRQEQNLFIAFITLVTRAAIEGGLPEETAFSLSDSFIQTSEAAHSPEEVRRLSLQAMQTFAQEVAVRRHGSYSAPVEQALDYIHRHLHSPLTLTIISDAIGLSPCYLSRLFRKETGDSIVTYIQRERVEAAKTCCAIPTIRRQKSEIISPSAHRVILSAFSASTPALHQLSGEKATFRKFNCKSGGHRFNFRHFLRFWHRKYHYVVNF